MTTHQNPTEIAPDHEETHRLERALLDHLDVDPHRVAFGSVRLELADDGHHLVVWEGIANLTTEELDGILTRIRPARSWTP
jgi:hypothetical protein